jgi:hypothetical protein
MRGGDEQTGELVRYVNLEKRVRSDHPLRAIRGLVNDAGRAGTGVCSALCADRGAVSSAGEAVASDALASLLFNSLEAAIDGVAGVRNRKADFHGAKRSNDTRASTTDSEALYRKGPRKWPSCASWGMP